MRWSTEPAESVRAESRACRRIEARERGSAVLEFALLSPIYALLVAALLHFGTAMLLKIDAARAVILASGLAGEQVMGDLPGTSFFKTTGFNAIPGSAYSCGLTDTQTGPDIYDKDVIYQDIQEVASDPIGTYVFKDGAIVYELDETNLSPYGKFINDNKIPELAEDIATRLNGWMAKSEALAEVEIATPFAGLEAISLSAKKEDFIPLYPDRGTHDGSGQSNFNQSVLDTLFSESMPDFEQGLEPFWVAN